MNRSEFAMSFSERMNSLIQHQGVGSNHSRHGVDINKLAKVAGVSYQMARKYTLGLALPDYHTIPKIAKWLEVSPGWLLFGENSNKLLAPEKLTSSLIRIETDLLKYIMYKCISLIPLSNDIDRVVNYIVGVVYDAAHINADQETIRKVIDMMFSSAMEFNNLNQEKRA